MVLAGGPDREREISLISGKEVAAALEQAGHDVRLRDIVPDNITALDEFAQWQGSAIFPILHGDWGEGGALQSILDERGIPYVGSGGPASALCMDKHRTKLVVQQHGIPTPAFELLNIGEPCSLTPPVVLKPIREGSSIDLHICRSEDEIHHARGLMSERHRRVLAEQFVKGKELTVGIIGTPNMGRAGYVALPPIWIVPATEYYDYQAKYFRNDTRYILDPEQIGVPESVLKHTQELAVKAHMELGCRHLSRVDFILDDQHTPWFLEVNTLPGFTTHSLVPMAARHMGIQMPQLVDRLIRLAM